MDRPIVLPIALLIGATRAVHLTGIGCTSMDIDPARPLNAIASQPPENPGSQDVPMCEETVAAEPPADADDGEVYAPMPVGAEAVPNRRSRLRLRELKDDEEEAACADMERLGVALAAKITDAADWSTAEGYISALPYLIYEKLQPYTAAASLAATATPHDRPRPAEQCAPIGASSRLRAGRRRRRHKKQRPPRNLNFNREKRMDEALDNLYAVERYNTSTRQDIRKARRRVGRIRRSQEQQRLRHRFNTAEKDCVAEILQRAAAARTREQSAAAQPNPNLVHGSEEGEDPGCPLSGEQLWQYFDGISTPRSEFDPQARVGTAFRDAVRSLPAATALPELLTEAPRKRISKHSLTGSICAPVQAWTELATISTDGLLPSCSLHSLQRLHAVGSTSESKAGHGSADL